MLTGVILAGGRSRRMGRDKATLPFKGTPLWQRQARLLRSAGATRVALVLRPDQPLPPGAEKSAVEVLRDLHLNAGPIAGLCSALTAPPLAAWYLVLAVDLPLLQLDWFGWLSGFCDDGIGAIARHAAGFEPLAAIYPAAAGPIVAAHIERGENSLQILAAHLVQAGNLRAVPLPARRRTQLANWNTPADLDPGKSVPATAPSEAANARPPEATNPFRPRTARVNDSHWPTTVTLQKTTAMIANSNCSRRQFLGNSAITALGVAAVGLLASRGQAQQSHAAPVEPLPGLDQLKLTGSPDENYWRKVRSQFNLIGGLTFLNNGTLGPVSRIVSEVHERWDRTLSEDPTNSFRSAELDVVRKQLAGFVNAAPEEVALTRSTTEGMNIFAHGLSWKAGDEVILSTLEHFGATDAYKGLEHRYGTKIKTIELPADPQSVEQIVGAYEQAITANTRVIVISHVAYVSGLVLPIKELADLAHRHGLLISVDGAQSFGVLPLDVQALGVDHYAAPGQKWLLAGTGTGFTYIRKDLQDKVQPLMGFYSAEGRRGGGPPVHPSARRYEQNGQYNIPAALGIGAALDLQLAIGKTNIEARARELATRLRSGLKEIRGAKLWTSVDPRFSANLTTVALEGHPPQDVLKALLDQAGIVVRSVKTDTVNGIRISTHFYNHPEEIDRLLSVLRGLAG